MIMKIVIMTCMENENEEMKITVFLTIMRIYMIMRLGEKNNDNNIDNLTNT